MSETQLRVLESKVMDGDADVSEYLAASGGSKVKPRARIESMLRETLERENVFYSCHAVDVRLHPERGDIRTLAQGEFHSYGYLNHKFIRFQGEFQLTGYQSSHTPLGLDPLYIHYDIMDVIA